MVKETVVEVEGLRKHYPPDVKAVDGVDFEIHAGEVFSLLGPNGAGKTTTVEILEGLRNPTAGQIRVLGAVVPKDYARIRKRVGVLPQNFDPFDRLKARETVVYWAGLFERSLRKKEVDALLRTVGLTARADALAMHLSGGEKRRLGIAMALVGEPELVFLDEPTTGLDPHGRRELWQVIRDLQKAGRTVLLTTHYLDEAEQLANRVAIMHKGKIVAQGTVEELLEKAGAGRWIVLSRPGEGAWEAVQRLGLPCRREDHGIAVHVLDIRRLRPVLGELTALDVDLGEIATRRDSLEEVFLKLVGARLEEGEIRA